MSIRDEMYMLRVGLQNKDFRPGAERIAAERRLAQLAVMPVAGKDRPRHMIALRPQR